METTREQTLQKAIDRILYSPEGIVTRVAEAMVYISTAETQQYKGIGDVTVAKLSEVFEAKKIDYQGDGKDWRKVNVETAIGMARLIYEVHLELEREYDILTTQK
jgi:hypothetical protein